MTFRRHFRARQIPVRSSLVTVLALALAKAHALFTEKVPALREAVDAAGLGFFGE